MAGDDNWQGIFIACLSNGSGKVSVAEKGGNLAIGSGVAIGNGCQGVPDFLLQDGAFLVVKRIS